MNPPYPTLRLGPLRGFRRLPSFLLLFCSLLYSRWHYPPRLPPAPSAALSFLYRPLSRCRSALHLPPLPQTPRLAPPRSFSRSRSELRTHSSSHALQCFSVFTPSKMAQPCARRRSIFRWLCFSRVCKYVGFVCMAVRTSSRCRIYMSVRWDLVFSMVM